MSNDLHFFSSNQVLIECGSASSFELSPRFANHPLRDRISTSQDQVNQDLENEIQEAMSETIHGEENLDGKLNDFIRFFSSLAFFSCLAWFVDNIFLVFFFSDFVL